MFKLFFVRLWENCSNLTAYAHNFTAKLTVFLLCLLVLCFTGCGLKMAVSKSALTLVVGEGAERVTDSELSFPNAKPAIVKCD